MTERQLAGPRSRQTLINCCLRLLTFLPLLPLVGCFGPPALHRSVLEYDKYYEMSEAELLLLNIARLRADEPPHFMMLSTINNTVTFVGTLSATFIWAAGAKPPKGSSYQAGPLSASSTESPLFTILPVQGQDYANKLYSPLTGQLSYFMLRDEGPRLLLLMTGEYLWVIDPTTQWKLGGVSAGAYISSSSPPSQTKLKTLRATPIHDCDENDTNKSYFGYDCSYYNNPLHSPSEQDKFLYLLDQLEKLKTNGALYMEKLGGDLDSGEVVQTSSTPPTNQELELAAKDGYRWSGPSGQVTSDKTYELLDKTGKVIMLSPTAPTPADMLAAAKAGYSWRRKSALASVTSAKMYRLIRPPRDSDKLFALVDFDIHSSDPRYSLSQDEMINIRQMVQPDPQDFVYIDLRKPHDDIEGYEPMIVKGYIKIRNFIEIMKFLADGSKLREHSDKQLIGFGEELPKTLDLESYITFKNNYLWVPSSEATKDRDRQAFALLYTLYQMSQVDTSKLPQIPVTISK